MASVFRNRNRNRYGDRGNVLNMAISIWIHPNVRVRRFYEEASTRGWGALPCRLLLLHLIIASVLWGVNRPNEEKSFLQIQNTYWEKSGKNVAAKDREVDIDWKEKKRGSATD